MDHGDPKSLERLRDLILSILSHLLWFLVSNGFPQRRIKENAATNWFLINSLDTNISGTVSLIIDVFAIQKLQYADDSTGLISG